MKVAALQMRSGISVADNLACAAHLIAQAAAAGAVLVSLPEYFVLMGHHDRDKVAVREPLGDGPLQDFLRTQAKLHGIWLAGGTIPLAAAQAEKVMNSTLVFNPQGEQVAHYDKIHLFAFEQGAEHYRELHHQGEVWQVGLSVCYDLRFPELFRAMSADLILAPAAFTYTTGKDHWELLLRTRAIENQCYVVAAAQSGWHENGRRTWGHSMAIDPWGQVLACHGEGTGWITADLSLSRVHEVRTALPALQHRVF
jgi:predicted amidohydrolase